MQSSDVPWHQIRWEYETTPIAVRALADHWQVWRNVLRRRMLREGWSRRTEDITAALVVAGIAQHRLVAKRHDRKVVTKAATRKRRRARGRKPPATKPSAKSHQKPQAPPVLGMADQNDVARENPRPPCTQAKPSIGNQNRPAKPVSQAGAGAGKGLEAASLRSDDAAPGETGDSAALRSAHNLAGAPVDYVANQLAMIDSLKEIARALGKRLTEYLTLPLDDECNTSPSGERINTRREELTSLLTLGKSDGLATLLKAQASITETVINLERRVLGTDSKLAEPIRPAELPRDERPIREALKKLNLDAKMRERQDALNAEWRDPRSVHLVPPIMTG